MKLREWVVAQKSNYDLLVGLFTGLIWGLLSGMLIALSCFPVPTPDIFMGAFLLMGASLCVCGMGGIKEPMVSFGGSIIGFIAGNGVSMGLVFLVKTVGKLIGW